MEYTQWDYNKYIMIMENVLILVVMEYTQWATLVRLRNILGHVLILVVMEYTQWADYEHT